MLCYTACMPTLVDKLMRALSAGAKAIELREVPGLVRPGEELRVTVEVFGGERGLRLEGVKLRLVEERLDFEHALWGGYNAWRKVAVKVESMPVRELAPGERLTLTLSLPIPEGVEPSAPHRRYRFSADVRADRRHPSATSLVEVKERAGARSAASERSAAASRG